MPQQLIYTSAPRGVVAGRSGHCTVARSMAMREALALQLEKLSYYQHLSLSGGQERPIYSCRVLDIRGSIYHVLSRIQDAGLDFTGRTNFIAHHLVFTPEEIRQMPSPPVILSQWSGWATSWSQEPQLLENEDWLGLTALSGTVSVPATNWQQLTGDPINGYGLLEARAGTVFRVDNLTGAQVLSLMAESLELLEIRDPGHDFRATAWQYTFTTSLQEQDNPADFRWRCLHTDNPASNRMAGPDTRLLSEIRALKVSNEEGIFARSGRQPPRFVIKPQGIRSLEGTPVKLQARAEGIPSPSYQWFTVDRAGKTQVIDRGTQAELVLPNPPVGISRYIVRASNSQGEVTSEVAMVSIEQKIRSAQVWPVKEAHAPVETALPPHVKSAADIERNRRQIEAKQAEVNSAKVQSRRIVLAVLGMILIVMASLCLALWLAYPWLQRTVTSLRNHVSTNAVPAIVSETETDTPPPVTGSVTNEAPQIEPKQKRDSIPPPATEFLLPEGWKRAEIGAVKNPYVEFISSRFHLSANAAGFAKEGDGALFVYQLKFTNTFQASLIRDELNSNNGLSGIMARASEDTRAAFLFIGATPSAIRTCRRDADGNFDSKEECRIPNVKQNRTIYFRIQSVENDLVPQYSFDANSWTNGNLSVSKSLPMPVGLAVVSGNITNKVVARFGGVWEK